MKKSNRITLFRSTLTVLVFLLLTMGVIYAGAAGGDALFQDGPANSDPAPARVAPERDGRPSILAPAGIDPATAMDLAIAMGVPTSDILAADLMGSDTQGVGVGTTSLGNYFPTQGGSFAILSTGLAADANLPNNEGNLTTVLDGLNSDLGEDLVRLHLQLRAPSFATCANFDFAFYSEEFPEFVGSIFNDTFTAQLNNSSLTTGQNNEVIAPGNFAFDIQGSIISVNTVFGVSEPSGSTYDGVTPLLRATAGVIPGTVNDFYFSVQDLGDSVWDSAVFMDKFFWSDDPVCTSGAQADTDGDGLLDDWETRGITVTVGTTPVFVDLPAMGATPDHKDIFVEIDYMGEASPGGHTHEPDPDAIQLIVDAFDNAPVSNPDMNTGIRLHVDYGSTAPLTWGAASTWGSLSQSDVLAHANNLGTTNAAGDYVWTEFDTLKTANFNAARAAIFHYNIWAHNLASSMGSTSGISRNAGGAAFGNGASDFLVSLGGWDGQTGTDNQQAGTFMHELGHNLGLRHGGADHTQWKPNYLSVMSYANQTRGLIINGTVGNFDYSRYDLADLTESNLNETVGINIPGAVTDTLGTRWFCAQDDMRVDTDAQSMDWNCDGDETDTSVSRNVNRGTFWNNNTTLDTLTSQNDWVNLVYVGGAIGAPGAQFQLPESSEVIDLDALQDATIPSAPSTPDVDLLVQAPSTVGGKPSEIAVIPIEFDNYGISTASSVVLSATLGGGLTYFGDSSGVVPSINGNIVTWNLPDVSLTAGELFYLQVTVPGDPLGTMYPVDISIASAGPEADPTNNATSMEVMAALPTYLAIMTR
jgi:hypothetical protein